MFFGLLWLLCFPLGEPNESDKGNSWLVCAVTGSLSTLALIAMCSLLYLCRERLLSALHYLLDRLHELDLESVSADNPSRSSSDDSLDGNCRALAESCTTLDDIQVKCSDGEATSLGIQESYPDALPHSHKVNSSL